MSSEDALSEVAAVACLAPSVANTQPWRWRVDLRHGVLDLHADQSRQLTATDPDGRLMMISCGAALHHADVAFAALGIETHSELVPDVQDPSLLKRWKVIGRHTVTTTDTRLHNALRTRRSDRRPFTGSQPLTTEQLERLQLAAGGYGVTAYVFSASQVPFLSAAARGSARIEGGDSAYQEEMARWTTGRQRATGDGVPADVAVPQVARAVPVRDFAPGGTAALDPGPGDDSATTYLALATAGDEPQDWLRVGEACSAVLLEATASGLASSVMSDVVEVAGARALVRSLLPDDAMPQLTIRVGHNPGAPSLPLTPRRPNTEVIAVI